MTKRIRTILFLIMSTLFLLAAPLTILYSRGWRLDFKTWKIVRIGAFYFRVFPRRASVFVDGKSYKTDYFFGSLFAEGFLPGEYQVKIAKEGFLSWKKKLKVEEERTTKVENIFLVPERVNFEILARETKELFSSQEQEKIILISENEEWKLRALDLKENLLYHLLEEEDVEEKSQIKEIVFVPQNKIFLHITTEEKEKYFILDVNTTSLTSIDLFSPEDTEEAPRENKEPVREISFSEDGRRIFFLQKVSLEPIHNNQDNQSLKNVLFGADLEERKASPLLENVVSYSVKENSIYHLDTSGFVFKTDLRGEGIEKINKEPLEIQEKDYKIHVFHPSVFLQEENSLYLFNEKKELFEKIFDDLEGIKICPDKKKLVFFSEHELWVFFLTKVEKQPPKEKGEKLFLGRFSKNINEVFWYTTDYLIFNAGEKIKVCETDERDRVQIWELKDVEGEDIFWDIERKILYFLKEKNLFVTEKLIK